MSESKGKVGKHRKLYRNYEVKYKWLQVMYIGSLHYNHNTYIDMVSLQYEFEYVLLNQIFVCFLGGEGDILSFEDEIELNDLFLLFSLFVSETFWS